MEERWPNNAQDICTQPNFQIAFWLRPEKSSGGKRGPATGGVNGINETKSMEVQKSRKVP